MQRIYFNRILDDIYFFQRADAATLISPLQWYLHFSVNHQGAYENATSMISIGDPHSIPLE